MNIFSSSPLSIEKYRGKTHSRAIYFLYFFLLAGALWNLLGWFPGIMSFTAGPMIIVTALAALVFHQRSHRRSVDYPVWVRNLYSWAGIVLCLCFTIEVAGVNTGEIFGRYSYGATLQPQLFGVPIAIGFAWLGMLLGSTAMLQRFTETRRWKKTSPVRQAAGLALLMTVFDVAMEPAAIKLDYWQWENNSVPLQNYAAWFIASFSLAWVGILSGALGKRLPAFAAHLYLAQMVYFILIWFK